jgi:hypothetical protein
MHLNERAESPISGSHCERDGPDEIEITPEMIEAGLCVLWDSGAVENPMDADRILIRKIFLAMSLHRSEP